MKLLDISRATLFNYTRDGKIKVIKMDNGYYDYNEESVFKIIKKDARINVIYSRVSTYKQKTDLENQIYKIMLWITFNIKFCINNRFQISRILIANVSFVWSWMNGNSLCTKFLNVFGHLNQIRDISASSIAQSGNFVYVYT